MNKTIFINCRFLTQPVTGVQRYGIELTKHLIKNNDGIKFICISPRGVLNDKLKKKLKVQLIGRFSGHLWEQIDLPIYLSKFNNPLLLNLANTAPLNYSNNIITIHDLAFTKNKKWFSKKFRIVYNFLIPRILKKAKHVITVSEFSKSEILNYVKIPYISISVVYNGIDHLPHQNHKIKKKDYYLMVGSLDPRKNLSTVIDAFIQLKLPLKIVGDKANSFLKLKTNSSDMIQLLGRVSDEELSKLYKEARGFIYLSFYEGFGIPPLEAFTFKTRSIVSNIEVFKEILGNTAIYTNPLVIEDIINTIREYDNNISQKKISSKEILEIRNKYSWAKSSEKLKKIIKKYKNEKSFNS